MSNISDTLKINFREFCVTDSYKKQIESIFAKVGFEKSKLPLRNPVSGERRELVEQYYQNIDWNNAEDNQKFLDVIRIFLMQSYIDKEKSQVLINLLKKEGYIFKDFQIYKIDQKGSRQTSLRNYDTKSLTSLKNKLINLTEETEAQKRGYAFERFLIDIFETYNLEPRKSFKLKGEQIDGSFLLNGDIYLLEAKWQSQPISQNELLIFREKVESKTSWARGVFISESGFSSDGLSAFSKGRPTNIIGIDGKDLYHVLEGDISLPDLITKKVRRATETGEFFIGIKDII